MQEGEEILTGRIHHHHHHEERELWFLLSEISGSLRELHANNQMHGAIHPDNIYVRYSTVVGLIGARLGAREPQRREFYPSGEDETPASDIYALGAIMGLFV